MKITVMKAANRLIKHIQIKFAAVVFVSSLCAEVLFPSILLGAPKINNPQILVLGDSQITFGSGPAYLRFFKNLKRHCASQPEHIELLKKLGKGRVGVIGVRSTSLPSWVSAKQEAKGSVCFVDPKWKVNAASFGRINQPRKKYIQIGQGHQYQFCKENLSPLEAVFHDGYYDPKLLVLSFLGNSAKEWAASPELAQVSVRKALEQLPEETPCVFLTTAPPYGKSSTELRVQAQTNLKKAFDSYGDRCSFVEGLNAKTIAANLGNERHFKQKASGKIKDPFHPNPRGARKFFSIIGNNICKAVFTQLTKNP